MSDFRKYLLELEAFYKNQAQCKQSLGGATAALSDERISKLFGHLINEFDAANNRPQWISVEDRLPEQGKHYWHTHVKVDGAYTPVCRGVYVSPLKKMRSHEGDVYFNFTHYAESNAPLPPTQED